jgi:hypothetical protein
MIGMSGFGLGGGVSSGFRFSSTRGRIQGSGIQGVNYPSPFFDVAHTYLPVTVKQMFRWCRYYFLTNPLINSVVFKMAEYPVTDILIDHENSAVTEKWTEYFQDHLRYRAFQVEVGLDYFCYGNAFVSIGYPFKKYLTCTKCDHTAPADKIRANWQFTNYNFRLTCPKCGSIGDAGVQDFYFRNPSGIKMIRWNPEDIEITYNDITGEYTYFYTIPATVRNDIVIGKKDVLEQIPQVFIAALREQKGIIFSKDNLFHLRRPTLATHDRGWGTPLLLPVLKDVFYLQVMKKAQESILLEHIVPLRILFPQAGSGTSDPYTTINLVDWREHVAAEIARWRYDNNYIPILPLPVGNQTVGGDGKALLLAAEIAQWSDQVVTGMGVPIEFVKGGMSYAGTNVSMRMLENAFIGYILRHKAMARWVMQEVANFLRWPQAKIRFKPFKMADDMQRKAFDFQLNQAGKLSDTTLLAGSDYNQAEENKIMLRETSSRLEATKKQQLAMAEMQGEQQLIMNKYQIKAQQAAVEAQKAPAAPGEPGGPDTLGSGTPGGQAVQDPSQQAPGNVAGGDQAMPSQQPTAGPAQSASPAATTPQGMQSPLSAEQRMQPGQAGAVDIQTLAYMNAQLISTMSPDQQQQALANLSAQSPELAALVTQLLQASGVSPQAQSPGVDTRPLPEKLPARREAQLV